MAYTVHKLELNKTITVDPKNPSSDGTFAILAFTSLVEPKNLEPDPADHLTGGEHIPAIAPGFYLFSQGTCTLRPGQDPLTSALKERFSMASETVWLESLWRDEPFANNQVIVRLLEEDGKTAFQIFRKTSKEHM